MEFTGLTQKEVEKKKKLGLNNSKIDAHAPSYRKIIIKNVFSLTNTILVPLIFTLLCFDLIREVFIFATYVTVNTIINTSEEIRIKKRLDKLNDEFQQKAKVIREGIEKLVTAEEVVEGDIVKAEEGDIIIANGKILKAEYLQIDESALTGESDYIIKEEGEIRAGSFVVTGVCYYQINEVGKNNYLNKLGNKSSKIHKKVSRLERYGNYFVTFFVGLTIILSALNYLSLRNTGIDNSEILLNITTIIAVVVPQTLLFIYSLNFIISVAKLAKKDILVQKKGAIDELASIDVFCMDKTGTITANKMDVANVYEFNSDKNIFGQILHSVETRLFGRNKTLDAIVDNFEKVEQIKFNNFEQIPFTSKQKFSAFQIQKDQNNHTAYVIGAFKILKNYVTEDIKEQIGEKIIEIENSGGRAVVIIEFNEEIIKGNNLTGNLKTNKALVFEIKEELNPGIEEVINGIENQGIQIKVISGDSLMSVSRIIENIGLDSKRAVDVGETDRNYSQLVKEYDVFTRVSPEDKQGLIKALQNEGHKVAMVGDGINDVLGLKQADVSIAMESGSKIARDTSDIVLINNDYKKIPTIFFEGDNIVFNLKLATKIFMARALMMAIFTIYFSMLQKPVPIMPSTTLIFSFIGNSFPSYFVIFSRQKISDQSIFLKDILMSSIPTGIFFGICTIFIYLGFKDEISDLTLNTGIILSILGMALSYSFYLLYEANKITNYFLIIFGMIFGIIFGAFQSVVPIYAIEKNIERIIMTILIFITSILIAYTLRITSKPGKKNKLINFIIPVGFIPVALFFPSRYYYSASPVPIENFDIVIIFTLLAGTFIILHHKFIVERFRKR